MWLRNTWLFFDDWLNLLCRPCFLLRCQLSRFSSSHVHSFTSLSFSWSARLWARDLCVSPEPMQVLCCLCTCPPPVFSWITAVSLLLLLWQFPCICISAMFWPSHASLWLLIYIASAAITDDLTLQCNRIYVISSTCCHWLVTGTYTVTWFVVSLTDSHILGIITYLYCTRTRTRSITVEVVDGIILK